MPTPSTPNAATGNGVEDKDLKKNAIGFDVADEREARMIVVGSSGEAPLEGIILGSTTNKLLHLIERPVLVVPAEEK